MMNLHHTERIEAPIETDESGRPVLRWFDRAVEAWLRHTTDELNIQEARHPRWFVSRREAA